MVLCTFLEPINPAQRGNTEKVIKTLTIMHCFSIIERGSPFGGYAKGIPLEGG